ncbi:MAG: universal stress protein [Mycobacteriaceae bacterium]
MPADLRPVVVGVDDSSGSDAALMWALADARTRGAPLRAVCAYEWEPPYLNLAGTDYIGFPGHENMEVRRTAEHLVTGAVDRLGKLHDGGAEVHISGAAVEGRPASVLVDESARAEVVVLGSRHLHALGASVLGSVAAGVSAHAACPVIVVRGPAGEPAERAEVIVGIDAAGPADALLGFGFAHASRHGVGLRAVLCWRPDPLATMYWRPEPPAPAQAEAWLSEALAGWREKYPDVEVHASVTRDHPVAGLVSASAAQYLLVVGSRTRQALLGSLLGSVSQGVLHHATCPVAVIPLRTGRPAR